MTEPSCLPEFIRDVVEGAAATEGAPTDAIVGRGDGAAVPSAVEFERCLLTLEERLYSLMSAEAKRVEAAEPELGRGWKRLETSIVELPLRYAPFFPKLAELFDWSEQTVVSQLVRLRQPHVWEFAGLPGIAKAVVKGGPTVEAAETLFVRFKPGVHFPRHHHTGLERVLVLEGSYADDGGVVHGPGELREWAVGTEHAFQVRSDAPCIVASVVFGRRFSAWPLRALAYVLEKRR